MADGSLPATLSFQIVEGVNEARRERAAAKELFGSAFAEQGYDCVQLLAAGGASVQSSSSRGRVQDASRKP